MTKEQIEVWRAVYACTYSRSELDTHGKGYGAAWHAIRAANVARRAVEALSGLLHDQDGNHRLAAALVLGLDDTL